MFLPLFETELLVITENSKNKDLPVDETDEGITAPEKVPSTGLKELFPFRIRKTSEVGMSNEANES